MDLQVQEIIRAQVCKRFAVIIRTSQDGLSNYLTESGARFEHIALADVAWVLDGCHAPAIVLQ
jgi:hypothetical protein